MEKGKQNTGSIYIRIIPPMFPLKNIYIHWMILEGVIFFSKQITKAKQTQFFFVFSG